MWKESDNVFDILQFDHVSLTCHQQKQNELWLAQFHFVLSYVTFGVLLLWHDLWTWNPIAQKVNMHEILPYVAFYLAEGNA